jgi:probable rRNA maturation factor
MISLSIIDEKKMVDEKYNQLFDIWKNVIVHAESIIKEVAVEGYIECIFIDNDTIQQYNNKYREKNMPTDVLSFPFLQNSPDCIGQIFLSYPMIVEQSKKYDTTISYELNKIFIHGFLHIFGFDHMNDDDYILMKKNEEILIEKAFEMNKKMFLE